MSFNFISIRSTSARNALLNGNLILEDILENGTSIAFPVVNFN